MPGETNPQQKGRHAVMPYLVVSDVLGLIEFTKSVFGAEVTHEPDLREDGSVGHAEVRIGDSLVMMGGTKHGINAMPAMLYTYVEDADAAYQKALKAGARSVMEPMDQPHGDRYGGVQDPWGNQWWMWSPLD